MTATVWNSLNLTARSLLHHQAIFFYRWRQFTIKYEFLFLVFMGFKNANRGNKKKTRWIKGMLSLSDFSGRRKVEKSDQITATTSFCYPLPTQQTLTPVSFYETFTGGALSYQSKSSLALAFFRRTFWSATDCVSHTSVCIYIQQHYIVYFCVCSTRPCVSVPTSRAPRFPCVLFIFMGPVTGNQPVWTVRG